jgi:ATP-dependent helicase STH1/SNF2
MADPSLLFLSLLTQAYPSYYVMIKKPVFMSQIKRKITNGSYKSVDAFRDDWLQMFDNARIFNEEGSWVYEDANVMQRELGPLWERFIVSLTSPFLRRPRPSVECLS